MTTSVITSAIPVIQSKNTLATSASSAVSGAASKTAQGSASTTSATVQFTGAASVLKAEFAGLVGIVGALALMI